MNTSTIASYPSFESRVRKLVQSHTKIKDEPLLLAVYYAPVREPQDVFLFEVAENFGGNSIDEDRNFFEVTYGPSQEFPMQDDQQLRLIITNPTELVVAIRENWPLLVEVRKAFSLGKAIVVHKRPGKGKRLLETVRG
jgi:hypothetical protein